MRALLVSLAVACLGGLALAQPSDEADTTADATADARTLEACIAEALDTGPLDACIGAVASRCIAKPGGETTGALVACHAREHAAWDGQLNAVYRRLNGDASGTPLQRAQRAWIVFRDANCAAMAAIFEGGSLARVVSASCMAETTARRTIELLALERALEG